MKSILNAFDSAVSSVSSGRATTSVTDANDMLSILKRLDEATQDAPVSAVADVVNKVKSGEYRLERVGGKYSLIQLKKDGTWTSGPLVHANVAKSAARNLVQLIHPNSSLNFPIRWVGDEATRDSQLDAWKNQSNSTTQKDDEYWDSDFEDLLNDSLDKNQKSVNQLSATFKPKTVAVLTAKTDPKNPMAGKLVGGCEESVENDKEVVEDLVTKMKRSLDDYLRDLDDKVKDTHILPPAPDRDLGKHVKIDRDLIPKSKEKKAVNYESPIKTIQIDDMNECGIYGDEDTGFEIRRGDKSLPTRFDSVDHATAAAETYAAMRKARNSNPDYREEK